MAYQVQLTMAANRDLGRLSSFLVERGADAAGRAVETVNDALAGLSEMPRRGRPVHGSLRELIIPFGGGCYIARYRVDGRRVVIARVFHTLERRPLA